MKGGAGPLKRKSSQRPHTSAYWKKRIAKFFRRRYYAKGACKKEKTKKVCEPEEEKKWTDPAFGRKGRDVTAVRPEIKRKKKPTEGVITR